MQFFIELKLLICFLQALIHIKIELSLNWLEFCWYAFIRLFNQNWLKCPAPPTPHPSRQSSAYALNLKNLMSQKGLSPPLMLCMIPFYLQNWLCEERSDKKSCFDPEDPESDRWLWNNQPTLESQGCQIGNRD